MVLKIDVKEIGRKPFKRLNAVILRAQVEVGGFINNAEILSTHPLQHINRTFYRFKQALRMRLMRETDTTLCGFIGGTLCPRNVCLNLHRNADKVRAKEFCQIQIGGYVTESIRSLLVIKGDGKITCDH